MQRLICMWNRKTQISKYPFVLRVSGVKVSSCNQKFPILHRDQATTNSVSRAMTWPQSQAFMCQVMSEISGFGDLEVACWPLVPKFRSRRIFQGEKILSTPSFGSEVKPFLPCRIFAACKRTRKCMRGSRSFRSKLPAISHPSSSSFHYQGLRRRHLAKDQGLYNKPLAAVHPGTLAAGTLPQYTIKKLSARFKIVQVSRCLGCITPKYTGERLPTFEDTTIISMRRNISRDLVYLRNHRVTERLRNKRIPFTKALQLLSHLYVMLQDTPLTPRQSH